MWGDALTCPTECLASAGNVELWGWFQFHTSVWRPHAPTLRAIFTPTRPLDEVLRRLLRRLLQSADVRARGERASSHLERASSSEALQDGLNDGDQDGAPTLLVIHLRAGDGGCSGHEHTSPDDSEREACEGGHAAGEEAAGEEAACVRVEDWEDRNTFWPAPSAWYDLCLVHGPLRSPLPLNRDLTLTLDLSWLRAGALR